MALSEGGGGFSTILRMSLLLVVCVVILECGAAPGAVGMDGTKAREPPEEEKLAELDLMTGQGMGKSRSKREEIPGLPDSKFLPKNGTFPDGKLCENGEEPFTPAETKAWRKYLLDTKKMEHTDPIQTQEKAAKDSGKCDSGKCNYDPKSSSLICGPVTEGIFEDGKYCLDGSDPPALNTEKTLEKLEEENKQATASYGKWCKSKKCNVFVSKKDELVYICSSSSVQPILLLLLTLVGLCVLRNFQ